MQNTTLKKISNILYKKSRVIIVDDNTKLTEIVKKHLETQGRLIVDISDNAEGAFNRIKIMNYDIAIIDVIMPEHDGFWLLEQIKTLKKAPQIIVISGSLDLAKSTKAYQLGAKLFMPKPFSCMELIEEIKKILNKSNLRDQNYYEAKSAFNLTNMMMERYFSEKATR